MLHPEEQPRAFRLPVKRLVIGAVVCALCLAAACTQAVRFNDARWVKPMDLSTYTYQPGDLPMLAAGALLLVYIFYVIVAVVRAALAARRAPNDTPGYTRRLSPWWGLCGGGRLHRVPRLLDMADDRGDFPLRLFHLFRDVRAVF